MPVYNGERFLSETLDSVLAQTFDDFRLVVSDNGSTDGTMAILEEYAARDPRITVLHSDENRGASWNYERVFDDCESPYFKWAAADDLLAPTYLERLVAALDKAPNASLAYPRTKLIDEEGNVLREIDDGLAARPGAPAHQRLRQTILNVSYGNPAFALNRTDAVRRTRLVQAFPWADYILLAEFALVGDFCSIPEPLFFRRMHEGMSMRASKSNLTSWFDPNRPAVRNPALNILRQYFAAVNHVGLRGRERLLAYLIIVPAWTMRFVGFRSRLRRVVAPVRRYRQ
jgi:glycosyltransferase involved in cell wall biosynthesis